MCSCHLNNLTAGNVNEAVIKELMASACLPRGLQTQGVMLVRASVNNEAEPRADTEVLLYARQRKIKKVCVSKRLLLLLIGPSVLVMTDLGLVVIPRP